MKYLILLLLFSSFAAFAADQCSSVWVFKPFKSCSHFANGLDKSKPGELQTGINLWTHSFSSGRRNQQEICEQVCEIFNKSNLALGLEAEIKRPITLMGESDGDSSECRIEVRKYPFRNAPNKVCGNEEKISSQVGGARAAIGGDEVTCLSCDHLSDQRPAMMVSCLRQNIENIIYSRTIEIRDSDLNAVSRQVRRLLSLSKEVLIENLQTTDQISFFNDFLIEHPAPENQNRGGGGNLPPVQ